MMQLVLAFLLAAVAVSLRPSVCPSRVMTRLPGSQRTTATQEEEETQLLYLIDNVSGRGAGLIDLKTKLEIENLIERLEKKGLSREVDGQGDASKLNGVWRLLYTSTPGNTQSPIQRSLTGYDGVSIFQVINLEGQSFLGGGLPCVSNTVVFGEGIGRLRVTALASTVYRKLVEPRKGDGAVFGLYPFGKSINTSPRKPAERIDFAFQEALFEFKEPFSLTLPYPVPFKLLGDEAKGFIDNTYYSQRFRIARGNKGTIFLLEKVPDVSVDKKAAAAAAINFVPSTAAAAKRPRSTVAILFPSQLGTQHDYDSFKQNLSDELGEDSFKVYVAPLERLDWPLGLVGSFFTREFIDGKLEPSKTLAFYFKRVDEAVEKALAETGPDVELVLLSHSIGGWVARAWLSEWAAPEVKRRVRILVSLGSPHNPPPSDSGVAKVDQTRGLLTYINSKFPGAHEKDVEYVSVIGRAVKGELSLQGGGERFLAFSSYSVLCGDGESEGDGIIPIPTATLSGAANIIVDEAVHSNFIPTPFRQAIFLDKAEWYGSPSVLKQWVPALKAALK